MNYKSRLIEQDLLEYVKYFKIVELTGARQVGKSTLLKHLFADWTFVTFDPLQDEYGVRADPDLFLDNFPSPLVLDEVQYVPELLPALKRRVDNKDETGQYIITGSQQFSVMKHVAESLAGRVGILHLEGMTPFEMQGVPKRSNWLDAFLSDELERLNKECEAPSDVLKQVLWRGSLPGLLELPNHMVHPYLSSYVQTYIERDVRLLETISNLANFSRFTSLCAALSGREINRAQLGREIGISPLTAKNWLDVLIYSYQFCEWPPYHGNVIKRLSKKSKSYIGDTGLLCYLQRLQSPDALMASPLLGFVFETFIAGLVRKWIGASSLKPVCYHWRTSGGAEVDMVLELAGKLYPLEVKVASTLSKYDARGIASFQETYGSQAQDGLIIYTGQHVRKVTPRITAVPWYAVVE